MSSVDLSDPHDWYIEVCAICGCQLGPGVGSRTQTGRCVVEEHRSRGGIVVRVIARPLGQQRDVDRGYLATITRTYPDLTVAESVTPAKEQT